MGKNIINSFIVQHKEQEIRFVFGQETLFVFIFIILLLLLLFFFGMESVTTITGHAKQRPKQS